MIGDETLEPGSITLAIVKPITKDICIPAISSIAKIKLSINPAANPINNSLIKTKKTLKTLIWIFGMLANG